MLADAPHRVGLSGAILRVQWQSRLDAVSRELDERQASVASWDGGDVAGVVDLLAWEERVAAVSADQPEARRQA